MPYRARPADVHSHAHSQPTVNHAIVYVPPLLCSTRMIQQSFRPLGQK